MELIKKRIVNHNDNVISLDKSLVQLDLSSNHIQTMMFSVDINGSDIKKLELNISINKTINTTLSKSYVMDKAFIEDNNQT